MNLIDVYDDNNQKKTMRIIMSFFIENQNNNYVIYEELDKSHTYVAKYNPQTGDLDTNISDDELQKCEEVVKGMNLDVGN
jgi:hypothetical protein